MREVQGAGAQTCAAPALTVAVPHNFFVLRVCDRKCYLDAWNGRLTLQSGRANVRRRPETSDAEYAGRGSFCASASIRTPGFWGYIWGYGQRMSGAHPSASAPSRTCALKRARFRRHHRVQNGGCEVEGTGEAVSRGRRQSSVPHALFAHFAPRSGVRSPTASRLAPHG